MQLIYGLREKTNNVMRQKQLNHSCVTNSIKLSRARNDGFCI